jgi:hypothetical protein
MNHDAASVGCDRTQLASGSTLTFESQMGLPKGSRDVRAMTTGASGQDGDRSLDPASAGPFYTAIATVSGTLMDAATCSRPLCSRLGDFLA